MNSTDVEGRHQADNVGHSTRKSSESWSVILERRADKCNLVSETVTIVERTLEYQNP